MKVAPHDLQRHVIMVNTLPGKTCIGLFTQPERDWAEGCWLAMRDDGEMEVVDLRINRRQWKSLWPRHYTIDMICPN